MKTKALFYNFLSKKFIFKKTAIPKIKKDEALVKVKCSSLCGTDLHIIEGILTQKVYSNKEIILGHCFSGTVEKTGKAVKKFKIGDRIFSSNFVWCDKCQNCKEEKENICDNRFIFGMELPGSHAEYLAVPERVLFHLPESIGFEEGSLITDLLALSLNSIRKVQLRASQKIAIFGAGTVGLTLGMLLRYYKIKNVFIIEPMKYRQNFAKKLFKPKIISKKNIKKLAGQFDVIFEASGNYQAMDSGFKLLKRGGKLVVIGVHDKKFELSPVKLVSRELSLFGIYHYNTRHIKESLRLIKDGKINLRKLITHKFSLNQGDEAYKLLKNKKCGRIVFYDRNFQKN